MDETILVVGSSGSAVTLAAVLGREPRTFRAYFEELAGNSARKDVT